MYVVHLTGAQATDPCSSASQALLVLTLRTAAGNQSTNGTNADWILATTADGITQLVFVKGQQNTVEATLPANSVTSGSGSVSLTADGLQQLRNKQLFAELRFQGVTIRGQFQRLMCPGPTGGQVPGNCTFASV